MFNEYYQQRDVENHALEPFYEYKTASRPEKEFVSFLENHKDHLDWWYKNGDKNKEDFAILPRRRTIVGGATNYNSAISI